MIKNFTLLAFATIASLCIVGCSSSRIMLSSAIERGEVKLSSYKYVVVYDSAEASHMELELEQLLEHNGLRVIGEDDVQNPSLTLGARYQEKAIYNGYGNMIKIELTVLLEDMDTDKTLLTASGNAGSRNSAWKAVARKLNEALENN